MEISPRKPSKRAQEPVDQWLQSEGYFRKHTPKDPTCLFRGVSEQVYMTQHYHIRVRKECIEFMRKMKHLFIENIDIPFDDYLEQMTCFTEWGGTNEIQAMSLLYKKEFVIFDGQKQCQRTVTNNGFKNSIYLCYTPPKHYETLYAKEFVENAAYCQSIVYQILYETVFQMPNIKAIVHKMLHDRTTTLRHDRFFLKCNLEIRDELVAEIYNKSENRNGESDDVQTVKNVPPFPYRVAKALDPNIYRNTDFDIWHEIRREVKNAGWTRHNSHELQVGGKCLVQMNYNEEDFDKTNNNSVYVSSLENECKENERKLVQQKEIQDPVYFCGHIQEISKNQGPVLVFIEELGEKKHVPYSALKPLPLSKNKQYNYLPKCKTNAYLESNQKWKKAYGNPSRKTKGSNVNILSTNGDKTENTDYDVNKSNFQGSPWKEEHAKMNKKSYKYSLEKYPDYLNNNSREMVPSSVMYDSNQLSGIESFKRDSGEEVKDNSFNNTNSENNLVKASKSDGTLNGDSNAEFDLYSKARNVKEPYYPLYSGEHISNGQMDDMLRSINCSVQKSVDINGSDLPLSDPFTLRFFYNLGLEYFRENNNWNYLTNGQLSAFGQWYQGMPPSEEAISSITNGVMQDCVLTEPEKGITNHHADFSTQSLRIEDTNKSTNDGKGTQTHSTDASKEEEGKDSGKQEGGSPSKDTLPRISRTNLGPRFKKNSDNRHHSVQQLSQSSHRHSQGGSNLKISKAQEVKEDAASSQRLQAVPLQVQAPTETMIPFQGPYMQQGMYSALSYYPTESETFGNPYYPPNPGHFSVPYIPPSDIPDNNNVQALSPYTCPNLDYAQAYSGLCPSYMCPQPTPFNMSPQNMQEHWYTVTGQLHYMPYAPTLPVGVETVCNASGQNSNQNALS